MTDGVRHFDRRARRRAEAIPHIGYPIENVLFTPDDVQIATVVLPPMARQIVAGAGSLTTQRAAGTMTTLYRHSVLQTTIDWVRKSHILCISEALSQHCSCRLVACAVDTSCLHYFPPYVLSSQLAHSDPCRPPSNFPQL